MSIDAILFQVLHRKTEEAAMATKRLKELLETRKSSTRESSGKYFSLILKLWLHLSYAPFFFLNYLKEIFQVKFLGSTNIYEFDWQHMS